MKCFIIFGNSLYLQIVWNQQTFVEKTEKGKGSLSFGHVAHFLSISSCICRTWAVALQPNSNPAISLIFLPIGKQLRGYVAIVDQTQRCTPPPGSSGGIRLPPSSPLSWRIRSSPPLSPRIPPPTTADQNSSPP